MNVGEYIEHDATSLAGLIRSRQVSAREVWEAAARAIDSVNPEINALVLERFESPLAHEASGPFGGVPFAIKDLVIHAEGVLSKAGTRMLGLGVPMPADSYLMARFRRAGLATMGVTATPEFGFNSNTEPVATGSCRNPWDLTRSAGGSSGGSSALVAARGVPVAHANDGGGSIRIPAASCGLVGLKPSRGRTTTGPDYADPLLGLGIEFAVTRTVRDCAALFDAVHGSEAGDRYLLPPPATSWASSARDGCRGRRLRVAFTDERYTGGAVDPSCAQAVRDVVRALDSMGHHVEAAIPPMDIAAFDEANLKVWCSFLADGVYGLAAMLGVKPGLHNLETTTLACAEYGRTLTALDLYEVERVMNALTRSVARFLCTYDAFITPTTAYPNTRLGHLNANNPALDARGHYAQIFETAPFTAVFNATGHPAVSLPLGTSPEGWPVGVQLVARYCDETTLFELAGDLERAMPWQQRRPAVLAHD